MEKLDHISRAILALVVLAAVSYFNAVGNPFVHDDIVFILQNPQVRDLSTISQVFDKSSFATAGLVPGAALQNPYYRPFLDIAYRLEFAAFGTSPIGYHLVNILLHLFNAILILIVTLRLTQRNVFSWCVAALFLVHPIQSEAVACISGISNLLLTTFFLLSFLQYLRLAFKDSELTLGEEALRYSGALLFFGAALLSKEQALVLPVILLLYECFLPHLSGKSNTGWRLRLAGFVIVAGGYLLWRKIILGGFLTSLIPNLGEFYLRLKSWPAMIMTHLQTIVYPLDLHYYRSHDILSPWVMPFCALLFLVAACFLTWKLLPPNRKALFAFGLGWYIITILPTTSIVPLVHEYSFIAAFEHFNYLPLAGLLWSSFVAGEYFLERLFHQNSYIIKKVCIIVLLFVGIVLTFEQTKMWAGEVPLFEKSVEHQPKIGRLRLLLAKAYFAQNDHPKAEAEFWATRNIMLGYLNKVKDPRVRPFYEGFLKESLSGVAACQNNFGVVAIQRGQRGQAVVHFKKALDADPGFLPARHNLEQLLAEKQ